MTRGRGSERPLAAGVDVGGTHVRVAVAAGARRSRPTVADTPRTVDSLIEHVAEAVRRAASGLVPGTPEDPEVGTLVVGLPCETDDGCVRWAPNLPFLEGVDLADRLRGRLGARVELVLDGQGALVGELAEGAARGAGSALLVAVGTGIGGALSVGGRVVRGAHGLAGAFGWLPDDAPPAPVTAIRHGSWERTASGTTLVDLAAPWGDVGALASSARGGDAAAASALHAYAVRLGRGIGSLASMLDPDVVVLAGGVAELFGLLEPGLDEGRRRAGSRAGGRVPLVPAVCGPSAGVFGCLHIATRQEWLW